MLNKHKSTSCNSLHHPHVGSITSEIQQDLIFYDTTRNFIDKWSMLLGNLESIMLICLSAKQINDLA
jgi:hypothetical protein